MQPVDQQIEPDAMAADNDEIGEMSRTDQLHLDRRSGGDTLGLRRDRDKPIRPATGTDVIRARRVARRSR